MLFLWGGYLAGLASGLWCVCSAIAESGVRILGLCFALDCVLKSSLGIDSRASGAHWGAGFLGFLGILARG